jgi:N-carbamoyl-L-amino-acid hydrolase
MPFARWQREDIPWHCHRRRGRCEATLDQRDLDPAVLATMFREARDASERSRPRRNAARWSGRASGTASRSPSHPTLLDLCDESIREVAGKAQNRMPSGPLHDAAEVSRAGIPTVMMFVQSVECISHNKIEDTREEHLEQAITAFDRLASKAMQFVASR